MKIEKYWKMNKFYKNFRFSSSIAISSRIGYTSCRSRPFHRTCRAAEGSFFMSIRADYHLHSSFSGDSQAPMESMIQKGMELGLTRMCFTEHMDFEFPVSDATPAGFFEVNLDSYLYDLLTYREKYRDRIRLLFGLELGLQAHLVPLQAACAASKPFDFIIGSSHLCAGKDPFQPYFWEGRSTEEALREYFSSIIENLETFTDFDVYGHLDYAVRYAPGQDKDYCYEKYADLFERILDLLLENGIGLEINTGGLGYGLRDVNPARAILRRYREKGGEIITIGSDAHRPQDLCRFFGRAEEILKDCGFRYYTVFEGRTPHFEKLD